MHPKDFIVPSPGPVGGRLALFRETWQNVVLTDKTVVLWAQEGLRLSWVAEKPPLRPNPWFFPLPTDQERIKRLDEEIQSLIAKRAIEEVSSTRGCYSLIFLVPKKSGKWRPVVDLSHLNRFLVIPRFKRSRL